MIFFLKYSLQFASSSPRYLNDTTIFFENDWRLVGCYSVSSIAAYSPYGTEKKHKFPKQLSSMSKPSSEISNGS